MLMDRQDACGGLVQEKHIRRVREETLQEGIQGGKSKTKYELLIQQKIPKT